MTVDETPEANAIATAVADRCHGTRKPNTASQRYAIIWQAARLGAIEAMKQPAPALADLVENPGGGFVCAGCSKGPEVAAAYVAAFDAMVEALENLPVEEWIEQDPHDGSARLIGYVMQAQGEWDNARTALQAARIARGDA